MRIVEIMKRDGSSRKRTPWLAYAAALALAAPMGAAQLALAQSAEPLAPISAIDDALANVPAFSHRPVEGRLTSTFGERPDPFTRNMAFHTGIDIAAEEGTPIVAAAGGRVLRTINRGGYGNVVEIDHGGGFVLRYAQVSAFDVRDGDSVEAGQVIARVGQSGRATAPHLHLEVWRDNTVWDPARFIDLPSAD